MLLQARGVTRSFQSGVRTLEVLRGVDLTVHEGEVIAILGASGSGKSTLLQILGALDRPTGGTVEVDGTVLGGLGEADLARFRNTSVGFVFQFHHLLPEFSACENVMMPALIAGTAEDEARDRARALLADVGLGEREEHRPSELSGGEQQRVAMARALVNGPRMVLCDEPTGNLDRSTSEELHALLDGLHRKRGTSIVIVTHDTGLAALAGRRLRLENGVLGPDE